MTTPQPVLVQDTAKGFIATLQHTARLADGFEPYASFCYVVRTVAWAVWHEHEVDISGAWRRIQWRLVRDQRLAQAMREVADWLEEERKKPYYRGKITK